MYGLIACRPEAALVDKVGAAATASAGHAHSTANATTAANRRLDRSRINLTTPVSANSGHASIPLDRSAARASSRPSGPATSSPVDDRTLHLLMRWKILRTHSRRVRRPGRREGNSDHPRSASVTEASSGADNDQPTVRADVLARQTPSLNTHARTASPIASTASPNTTPRDSSKPRYGRQHANKATSDSALPPPRSKRSKRIPSRARRPMGRRPRTRTRALNGQPTRHRPAEPNDPAAGGREVRRDAHHPRRVSPTDPPHAG
jgi:hypothetical protein